MFSLSVFHLPAPPDFQASPDCVQGDKRADERKISGSRHLTSTLWRRRVAEGGPGRVTGLPTSCAECFSEGRLARGPQNPFDNPGSKTAPSPILRRVRVRLHRAVARTGSLVSEISSRPCQPSRPLWPPTGHPASSVVPPLYPKRAIFRLSRKKRVEGQPGSCPPRPGEQAGQKVPSKSLSHSWSLCARQSRV